MEMEMEIFGRGKAIIFQLINASCFLLCILSKQTSGRFTVVFQRCPIVFSYLIVCHCLLARRFRETESI